MLKNRVYPVCCRYKTDIKHVHSLHHWPFRPFQWNILLKIPTRNCITYRDGSVWINTYYMLHIENTISYPNYRLRNMQNIHNLIFDSERVAEFNSIGWTAHLDLSWNTHILKVSERNGRILVLMCRLKHLQVQYNISNTISQHCLTHWGRDKMADISQTTFSNVFCSMKIFEFRLKFHCSLFLGVQWTKFQHWFR